MRKEILEEYKKVRTVLLTVSPFLASLLSKARIVITTEVPTAAVDNRGNLAINPEFWVSLRFNEKVFVIAHEVMHWAFLDHRRVASRDKTAWNVVADGVNNDILLDILDPGRLSEGMVTLQKLSEITGVSVSDLRKMAKEKIYELLPKQGSEGGQGEGKGGSGEDGDLGRIGRDLLDREVGGDVLQEGHPDIYNAKDPTDLENAMKRAIAEAEQMQKLRGTMPVGLQRLVDELLRPKLPWRTLLKQALKDGLGRTKTQSWKRPSRRHPDYPGHRRLTSPTVWVGVDTSGSISGQELKQFLSEVLGISKANRAKVVVIPWDAEMYEPIELRSPAQIRRVAEGMKGGGGTDPTEFLQHVLRRMKPLDAVVVLSDGYIGNPASYEDLATPIAHKASTAIFVSTEAEVKWPKWKFIKLE